MMTKPIIPPTAPLQSNKPLKNTYTALIAIPACHEFENLPQVIQSLEQNDTSLTDQTLIIVNVNNRLLDASSDNAATLKWLDSYNTHLHLGWLDSTKTPFAYPEKFGVGLARNQCIAAGLHVLEENAPLISLDADSPVNSCYLREIFKFSQKAHFNAGHVNFQHQLTGLPEEIAAIKLYERHLHLHRNRLLEAGSPHAWYAIGSTIVCSKAAYLKSGGYQVRRMAGEDFYLLQQLSKTGCNIEMIEHAFVYPSNRASKRVPFGTGKAVSSILEGKSFETYHEQCYIELKVLLQTIARNLNEPADIIYRSLAPTTVTYLEMRQFADVWDKLKRNSRDNSMLIKRFHEWFDAFETLKFIHHLSNFYPKQLLTSLEDKAPKGII